MKSITWKLHLASNPDSVFRLISTDKGIMSFWAEKAERIDDKLRFYFPNGQTYESQIVRDEPSKEFCIDYFDTVVTFTLSDSTDGGTDLTLTNANVPDYDFADMHAGWISVLMNLNAVADFNCDLRNHDSERTWDQGYVEN